MPRTFEQRTFGQRTFGQRTFGQAGPPPAPPHVAPSLLFALDYLTFDNLQQVNYFVRAGDPLPTLVAVLVKNALLITQNRFQMQAQSLTTRQVEQWHLWTPELSGIVPKVGDVVQDSSGVRWDLTECQFDLLTNHWTCSTIRER